MKNAKALVKNHKLFLCIFLLLVLVRIPLLKHIHEYQVLGSDFNATVFGLRYWEDAFSEYDDLGVGENSRYMVFSNLSFFIPALFYKIGVPFEFFDALHVLFGMPLLLLGMYAIAYALFRNQGLAAFSALFFHVNGWIFDFNCSYPLLFDKSSIYYGDISHIAAAFFLAFLLAEKYKLSGLFSLLLLALNPTYGLTSFLLLSANGLYKLFRSPRRFDALRGAAISLLGVGLAFLMVKASSPISAPVPGFAREFSIHTYIHISPYAFNPPTFLRNMAIVFAMLLFCYLFERHLRPQSEKKINYHFIWIHKLLLGTFFLYLMGAYFILYVFAPTVFIMLAPSKSVFFLIMAFSPYIAIVPFYLISASYNVDRKAPYPYIVVSALYLFCLQKGVFALEMINFLYIALLYVICFSFFDSLRSGRIRLSTEKPHVLALLLLLLLSFGKSAKMANDPNLKYASAFYDISLKVKSAVPKDAILIPYKLHGAKTPYGQFQIWPIRTHSQRGTLPYWWIGKNAYFNSRMRMRLETISFAAAGIDLWGEIKKRVQAAKIEGFLAYYTGFDMKNRAWLSPAPPVKIYRDMLARQESYINSLDLPGYMDYGRGIHATHVVICKDPGMEAPPAKVIVENDYFLVVEIPK